MSTSSSSISARTPVSLARVVASLHSVTPDTTARFVRKVAACGALLLIGTSCSGGAREKDVDASRPDAVEKMRRTQLVMAEFGRTMPADADPSVLTCILDEPYGSLPYQLGFEGVSVETSAMAAVVACSTDEWDEVAEAVATLHQVDESVVRPLVLRAAVAVGGD